jgi:hypothetical protein
MRQDPFLHPDHVHVRELEPLGAVQCHQRHGVLVLLAVAPEIVAPAEHGVLQEAGE